MMGSKGAGARALPVGQISFIFMQFSVNICPNSRLAPPTLGLVQPILKIQSLPLSIVHTRRK